MSVRAHGGGHRGSSRIDITEEDECRFWAERLGVCPTELAAAVGAVGNEVNDVWLYVDHMKHDPRAVSPETTDAPDAG